MNDMLDMDDVEIRASLDSATDGALVFGDRMAEMILDPTSDRFDMAALAVEFLQCRRIQRVAKKALGVDA